MKKVLFTSPGRRVELIQSFKKEFVGYEFIGGDYFPDSPANYFLDKVFKLPFQIDYAYPQEQLGICQSEEIELIVPLIDPELALLKKYRLEFEELGARVLLPNDHIVDIAHDKYLLFNDFKHSDDVNVPNTCLLKDYVYGTFEEFSTVILKPKSGSSSIGIHKVKTEDVLDFAKTKSLDTEQYLVQEYIDFDYEVTIDVFGTKKQGVIELCQRKRLKTRGGEVERGITLKEKELTDAIVAMDRVLKFDSILNVQFMHSKTDDKFYLCEINARFGGGFPLSYNAGANMIGKLTQSLKDVESIEVVLDKSYRSNFYMLRYDTAVYREELISL